MADGEGFELQCYAANFGMGLSTHRKNRDLQARAATFGTLHSKFQSKKPMQANRLRGLFFAKSNACNASSRNVRLPADSSQSSHSGYGQQRKYAQFPRSSGFHPKPKFKLRPSG
jgi:hypothetical protein